MDRETVIEQLQSHLFQIKKGLASAKLKEHAAAVSPAQREVLRQLFPHHDGMNVKDLAEELGISSSAVTQHIDELEKIGFVTREVSPDDRRSVIVKMSARGRQRTNLVLKEIAKQFEDRLRVLSDKELETFLHLIEKLTNQ